MKHIIKFYFILVILLVALDVSFSFLFRGHTLLSLNIFYVIPIGIIIVGALFGFLWSYFLIRANVRLEAKEKVLTFVLSVLIYPILYFVRYEVTGYVYSSNIVKCITLSIVVYYYIVVEIKEQVFCETDTVYYKKIEGTRKSLGKEKYEFVRSINKDCKQYEDQYTFHLYYCENCKSGFIEFGIDEKEAKSRRVDLNEKEVGKIIHKLEQKPKPTKSTVKLFLGITIVLGIVAIWVTTMTIKLPLYTTNAYVTSKVFYKETTMAKSFTRYKQYNYYCNYKNKQGKTCIGYFRNAETYEDWKVGEKVRIFYTKDMKDGDEIISMHSIECCLMMWGFALFFAVVTIREGYVLTKEEKFFRV